MGKVLISRLSFNLFSGSPTNNYYTTGENYAEKDYNPVYLSLCHTTNLYKRYKPQKYTTSPIRKYFYFIILSAVLFSNISAQEWHWQNPLPQGNTLFSVQYVTENLIWAGGDGGTLIKSTDGGDTWEVVLLSDKLHAYSLFFINEQKGWVCVSRNDQESKIYATTDGGKTWITQMDIAGISNFKSIVFADERKGWAGEYNIWATSNGGDNWYLQANAPGFISSFSLLDSLHLWAVAGARSGGPILKTTDGGLNWITDSTITWALDVQFIDSLTGWASGSHYIGKTTDGGASWVIQYMEIQEKWLDILMWDKDIGWSVSESGKIVSTTNGGINWFPQDNPTNRGLYSISFKNAQEGIIAGDFGTMLKTTDDGNEWNDLLQTVTGERLSAIYFLNKNKGWIIGNKGLIITTSNGGNTWIERPSGITNVLSDIYFVNETLGWATGDNIIMRSTDGGLNWLNQGSPINRFWSDIEFKYYPVGWIIGGDPFSDGRLLKTTDGGESWNLTSVILPYNVSKIQFTSENIGWIMVGSLISGSYQRIYKTTDGGENWDTVLTTKYPANIESMSFVNDSTGFVSTFTFSLYKTIDGGDNWDIIQIPSYFPRIHFLDENNGWACAAGGNIYYSNDGGITWELQVCPLVGVFDEIFMFDNDNGWVISYNNILSNSKGTTGIIDYPAGNSKNYDFKLYQNYPNPFNSQTSIYYYIGKETKVTIKIYDILGREVKTLVNKEKPAGIYTVNFSAKGGSASGGDASYLASGIYFYTITTGEFSQTKKMVLLK